MVQRIRPRLQISYTVKKSWQKLSTYLIAAAFWFCYIHIVKTIFFVKNSSALWPVQSLEPTFEDKPILEPTN